MLGLFLVSIASAQQLMTYQTGFVPSDPYCLSLKNSLCYSDPTAPVDPNCLAFDLAIMGAVLQMPAFGGSGDYTCTHPLLVAVLGGTPCDVSSYGPAFVLDQDLAGILAFMAFATTVSGTAATSTPLTQIYPTLNTIYECEARALGLVWANYHAIWDVTQVCMNDADCIAALDSIREVTSSKDNMLPGMNKKAEANWDYVPFIDMYLPLQSGNQLCSFQATGMFCADHDGNNDDALCNIVFAALAEENAMAMTWITTATATMFDDPDEIVAHCNVVMAKNIGMLVGLTVSGAAVGGILLTAITCCCMNRRRNKEEGI